MPAAEDIAAVVQALGDLKERSLFTGATPLPLAKTLTIYP